MLNSLINEIVLKNGLKIIVKENHRAPIAIFQIFYRVGSSFESYGFTGLSHALEHMMFRGTRHYSAEYFLQTISGYGGQQNAYTTHDYTAYYETMRVDKLSFSFKFEADRMQHLSLSSHDFHREKQIVMEERRLSIEDEPHRLALERFTALGFLSSPYRHPIIGWMDDIAHMKVQDLRRWYKSWYVPNNAIIVVIGDVNLQKVKRLADIYFAPIASRPLPQIRPLAEIKPLGIRTAEIHAHTKVSFLILGFNVPVIHTVSEKWEAYALLVLGELLAGSDNARLKRFLERDKTSAMDIAYHYSTFNRMDGLWTLSGIPMEGHTLDELTDDFLKAIKQLQIELVDESELNQIKVNIIANRVYEADSISNQANEIGGLEAVGLSWQEIEVGYEIISNITPAQIKQVAEKYLNQDHFIQLKLIPETI